MIARFLPLALVLSVEAQVHAQPITFPATFSPCVLPGVAAPAWCGSVRVFEDRARRRGRTIDLRVVVLPARAARPAHDPVFVLVGGPGQGAADLAPLLARQYDDIVDRRDVVFIDQRGTGGSNGLACAEPRSVTELFGALYVPALIRDCRSALARRADLTLYTTIIAVDDFDEVRERLGYARVNLIGGSYGTRTALEYARRHPSRVRALVLDGVAPAGMRAPLGYAADAQRALDHLLEDCAADATCRRAHPNVRADLAAILERLERGPATVRLADTGGATASVRFSRGDFGYALRGMLYGADAMTIPLLLQQTRATGDLTPFAEAYVRRARVLGRQVYAGHHLAVFCAEDVGGIDSATVQRATAKTFLGDHLVRQYQSLCADWPRATVSGGFFEPVRSTIPTLLFSGRRDPSTPPEKAEDAARFLPNSRHIVFRYGGHGFTGARDPSCKDRLTLEFLNRARTTGLDASCVHAISAPPFAVSER